MRLDARRGVGDGGGVEERGAAVAGAERREERGLRVKVQRHAEGEQRGGGRALPGQADEELTEGEQRGQRVEAVVGQTLVQDPVAERRQVRVLLLTGTAGD